MKKVILSIVACLSIISANAQGNSVTIENLNYEKGVAGSFDIMVQTEENLYSGFQTVIYLPTGTVIAADEEGFIVDEIFTNKISRTTFEFTEATNPEIPSKAGFDKYLIAAYKTTAPWNLTEPTRLFTFNYGASDVEKMKIYLTKIVLGPFDRDGTKLKLEDVESTGITGIAADKAEAANDGKFVENNRVVIKKAGVKYSTTGQVVK